MEWVKLPKTAESKDELDSKTDEELMALHKRVTEILKSRGFTPKVSTNTSNSNTVKVPSGYFRDPKTDKLYKMRSKKSKISRAIVKAIADVKTAKSALSNYCAQKGVQYVKADSKSGEGHYVDVKRREAIDLNDCEELFKSLPQLVISYQESVVSLREKRAKAAADNSDQSNPTEETV